MERLVRIPVHLAAILVLLSACGSEKEKPTPVVEPPPKPVAMVSGPTEMQIIGNRVVVSGEGSHGTSELEYRWSLTRPEGSQASFEFENREKNAFTVDAGGTFQVQLVVADVGGESEPVTTEIHVAYAAPTAVLELLAEEPTVALEHQVVANGGKSNDPAGRSLKYEFRLTQRPSRSEATIQADGEKATFSPDRGGLYEVGLKVGNETTWSEEVRAQIEVLPPKNRRPTARAGDDRGARVGTEVKLNGSASSDPDEDELTFQWTFISIPEESEAALSDADQKIASFTPDVEGQYVVELEVSDGEFSDKASVTITGTVTQNIPPVIAKVTINGVQRANGDFVGFGLDDQPVVEIHLFDANEGDVLTSEWSVTGPGELDIVEISPTKRRLEPVVEGHYTLTIVASDGQLESNPFSLDFRFRGDNKLPVAVLETPGGVVAFKNNTTINLDGSKSYDTDEPEDPILQYRFSLVSAPPGVTLTSLSQNGPRQDANFTLEKKTVTNTYNRPYVFQLVVEDAFSGLSEPTTLEVHSLNNGPTARSLPRYTATLDGVDLAKLEPGHPTPGSSLVLNGELPNDPSFDPDGDELSFQWVIVEKPDDDAQALVRFDKRPSSGFYADTPGLYRVELTVTDNDPNPLSSTFMVEVEIQ